MRPASEADTAPRKSVKREVSLRIDVPVDGIRRDVERRAEDICIAAEEVRRAEDATSLSLVPVRHDAGIIGFVRHGDTESVRNVLERDAV